jgi:hypothetical protein
MDVFRTSLNEEDIEQCLHQQTISDTECDILLKGPNEHSRGEKYKKWNENLLEECKSSGEVTQKVDIGWQSLHSPKSKGKKWIKVNW